MDKGFNDDELADIMSEIESLEQEFASDDEVVKAQEPGLDEVAQSVAAMVADEEEDVESEVVEAVAEVEDTEEAEEADEPEPMIAQQEEVEEAFEEEQAVMEQAPVIKHSDSSPESSSDDEMDEVLEELTSMSVEDIVPQ